MIENLPDPVLSVPESAAEGDIARYYADIREAMAVPIVDLFWRHLAVIPGALGWAWQSIKPLYERNMLPTAATVLCAGIAVPGNLSLSQTQQNAAQLDAEDMRRIALILEIYERSSALDLLAASTLMARLNRVSAQAPIKAAHGAELTRLELDMPPLVPMSQLADALLALLRDLDGLGGASQVMPTLLRHLSQWPSFLALSYGVLAPAAQDDELANTVRAVVVQGHIQAASLHADLASPDHDIDADGERLIRGAITAFVQGPLAKTIVYSKFLRQALQH